MKSYPGTQDILRQSGSINEEELPEKQIVIKRGDLILDSKECMMLIFVNQNVYRELEAVKDKC